MNKTAKRLLRTKIKEAVDKKITDELGLYSNSIKKTFKRLKKERTPLLNTAKKMQAVKKEISALSKQLSGLRETLNRQMEEVEYNRYAIGINEYTTEYVEKILLHIEEEARRTAVPAHVFKKHEELSNNADLLLELSGSMGGINKVVAALANLGIEIDIMGSK